MYCLLSPECSTSFSMMSIFQLQTTRTSFSGSFNEAYDRVLGVSLYARFVCAISWGYFTWDICHVFYNYKIVGIPFKLHAIMCFGVYTISTFVCIFYPSPSFSDLQGKFMLRHALIYLAFEISTIFINFNFFLEQSPVSLILLLPSFLLV